MTWRQGVVPGANSIGRADATLALLWAQGRRRRGHKKINIYIYYNVLNLNDYVNDVSVPGPVI